MFWHRRQGTSESFKSHRPSVDDRGVGPFQKPLTMRNPAKSLISLVFFLVLVVVVGGGGGGSGCGGCCGCCSFDFMN